MSLNSKIWLVERPDRLTAFGHFFLRTSVGLMIFYIHGWHKLEGWIAYLENGKPWQLAGEIAEMSFPAPLPSAVAATLVQLFCSLFVVFGWFTRLNATLLAVALSGAVLQNILAHRDPQLALLYTLIVLSLIFMGGGEISLDAKASKRTDHRKIK